MNNYIFCRLYNVYDYILISVWNIIFDVRFECYFIQLGCNCVWQTKILPGLWVLDRIRSVIRVVLWIFISRKTDAEPDRKCCRSRLYGFNKALTDKYFHPHDGGWSLRRPNAMKLIWCETFNVEKPSYTRGDDYKPFVHSRSSNKLLKSNLF